MMLLPALPASTHEATRPVAVAEPTGDAASADGASETTPVCHLKLQLFDADTGVLLPGLVRIRTVSGDVVPLPRLLNRGTGLDEGQPGRDWYVVTEPTVVEVPRAPLRIEAMSGLETELAALALDLTELPTAKAELRLKRFFRASANAWRSGNTHLHLMHLSREQADRYLQTIPVGDQLELVFVSHLRRLPDEQAYITNEYSKADLQQLDTSQLKFGFGEEHRHNYGRHSEGYGHVMLLDMDELIRPISIGPGLMKTGTDSPSLSQNIHRARDEGGRAIWCHQTLGLEDIPNWVLGALDAQNIFDGSQRANYDECFYPYLNIGLRVPFSTGTDWFIYDFSRVYVELPGELTATGWLDALASGRSFITNGPFLEFMVAESRPGDEIDVTRSTELPVVARAVGRTDFGTLQVIQNGQVVESSAAQAVDGHFEAQLDMTTKIAEPGWIAARIDAELANGKRAVNEMGGELFAHTSPVYVTFAGRSIFRLDAADKLLKDMEASLEKVIQESQFASDAEAASVLDVYRQGISALQKMIIRKSAQ